ncbi:diguanylate cyclase (GGDEF) domain-containing protein [Fibrobacter sp. UWB12]|nr:diguanylate cyclase (GGDEF) domain-containing protein [Fibrobacter sp. UWB12]SIO39171.1 diguanylate cyclase (GGDEF) domain-containing protein [Fibrobacter sp. UWB11]
MEPLFNLESIYVTNAIGIVLIAVMIVCNLWRFQTRSRANRNLLMMMFLAMTSCIADPISYTMKGVTGLLPKIAVYFTSTWLFAANMLAVFFWVRFLSFHLNGGMPNRSRIVVNSVVGTGLILLVINFFVPIVFSIDDNNLYSRTYLYFLYMLIDYSLVVYSLVIYFKSKAKGGALKFFPIWVYIVPILVGGIIQSLFYGISVIPTSIAVSIAGVLASLQNEMIYYDQLTGLFNRSYLLYLLKKYVQNPKMEVTGIMIDLNGFKHINDEFGHAVGDDALVISARILKSAVNNGGSVIRYAGDEFIVLLNTQNDGDVEKCIAKIRTCFDGFNKGGSKPYVLSVSVGSHKLHAKTESVDTFINVIDARMYEDKKAFYASHAGMDRRKH